MTRDIVIELFSPMPSNKWHDCKLGGELLLTDPYTAIEMVSFLVDNEVEFAVSKIERCLLDMSYDYWKREYHAPNTMTGKEGE